MLTLPPAPHDGPLAIAFSGGLDSTVLLHLAAADPALRARGLRALHVDHGLHPDSADWARACGETCARLGVAFQSRRVAVRERGNGLEAAAREARHAALLDSQRDGELIALAHHRDDQAETVLLRLLRGSGDGLGAMRTLRPFGRGWLWRPLLADECARRLAQVQGVAPRTLVIAAWRELPTAWRGPVLRAWLSSLGLPPLPARALAILQAQVLAGRPDALARYASGPLDLRRWRGLLHAGPFAPPLPSDWRADWDGRVPLALPGGRTLALRGADAFDGPLSAHARRGGERLRLPGRAHHHLLKHLLQDLGLPPWERAALPVLEGPDGQPWAFGDVLLAAPLAEWLQARGARLRLQD